MHTRKAFCAVGLPESGLPVTVAGQPASLRFLVRAPGFFRLPDLQQLQAVGSQGLTQLLKLILITLCLFLISTDMRLGEHGNLRIFPFLELRDYATTSRQAVSARFRAF